MSSRMAGQHMSNLSLVIDVNRFSTFFQALTKVSNKLKPLEDGCDNNRRNWLRLAEQRSKKNVDEQSKEKENKEEENNSQQ